MKHLLTLTLLIAFAQLGFSQSACDNWNTLQGKSESDFTDITRLKIYWSKRCACESGQITGGDWDYTVKLVNDNYDMYHERRNKFPNEYSYNGSIVPDRKISANECSSSSTMVEYSVTSTNCNKPAFTKEQDPQQYGNDFMMARCQCEEGVPYQEQAKQLEARMEVNYNNAKTYYGNSWVNQNLPQVMKWEECPLIRLGQDPTKDPTKDPNSTRATSLVYTGRESDLDKLKDQYIETFSESGSYNAYVAGENIKRLGVSMAKDFSDNLKSIGQLIETTDPTALQKDYIDKIRNIENLEAQFNEESNSYFFQSGQQLGNSINNNDYESAMFQAGGLLNAHLERKEVEKELAKQKAELQAAKRKQMRALYNKAKSFNNMNRSNFLKLAASSEDSGKEQYYLEMVENIDCYQETMWDGYILDKPNWLDNKCPVPTYTQSNLKQNNLVSEDVRLSKLGQTKYAYFKKTGHNEYRDAAIAFASAAITEKPKSQYFSQLGEYYTNYSNVLALGNFMAAKEYGGLNQENQKIVDSLTPIVQGEIKAAITGHNLNYLNSFLKVGLDDVIRVEGNGLLEYSIHLDEADAMQSILNSRVAALSDKQKTDLIQRSIFLMTVNNSHSCIQRIVDLGISTDFKRNKKHSIDLANEVLSEDVFQILLSNTNNRSYYENKYKDSPIHALISINQKPILTKELLAMLDQNKDLARVVSRMVEQFDEKPNYVEGVGESPIAKAYIKSSERTTSLVKLKFVQELTKPYNQSSTAIFIEKGLIELNKIPTLKELGMNHKLDYVFFHFEKQYVKDENGLRRAEYDTISFDPNENLAYVAWKTRNPKLFKAIDDKFNLNDAMCSNGLSLFENMIRSKSFTSLEHISSFLDYHEMQSDKIGFDKDYKYMGYYRKSRGLDSLAIKRIVERTSINYYSRETIDEQYNELLFMFDYEADRMLFYSNDFSFNKKIGEEYPLFIYLNSTETNICRGFELFEILKNYEIDGNQTNVYDGGSLIHWLIECNANRWLNLIYYPDANFIKSLNINLDIKNDAGQTAADLYKFKKKSFYSKKSVMFTFRERGPEFKGTTYYDLIQGVSEQDNTQLLGEWMDIVLGK